MVDDDRRVVLEPISGRVNCEHEYINASYIDVRPSTQYTIRIYHWYSTTSDTQGYSERRKYIATQGELVILSVVCIEILTQTFAGPLPNTVTDFWWLVWQERIHVVAMVTSVVEGGQQKCEQYWPDQGTQEYGPFKVTLTEQQVFADYTVRQLFVAVSIVVANQWQSSYLYGQ